MGLYSWLGAYLSILKPGQKGLLILLLALSLARGVLYAAIVPPWQAPDEPKHFEYTALLHDKGRLVSREDASLSIEQEIVSSMKEYDFWRFGYANSPPEASRSFSDVWWYAPTVLDRPPLYYLTALPFYSVVAGQSTGVQLYTTRLFSVFLGMLIVLIALLATRALFPGDAFLSIAVPAFVLFLPMHTFVSSTVNSDNLANLIGALFLLAMLRGLRQGLSWPVLGSLLALLVAGLFTKRTLFFLFPLFILFLALHWPKREIARNRKRILIALGGILGGLSGFLVVGRVDVLGAGRWILDRYLFNYSALSNLEMFARRDYTPEGLGSLYSSLFQVILQSFWAQFGWMNVAFDEVWYNGIKGAGILALGGLILYTIKWIRKRGLPDAWVGKGLLLYAMAILLVLVIMIGQATAQSYPASQGRYLYPVLIPIATFFMLGLKTIVPAAFHRAWLLAILSGLFLFDMASQTLLIIPFYYG